MEFFKNILSAEEIKRAITELKDGKQTISLGTVTLPDPKTVISLMELWCPRVDTVVNLDIDLNGSPSENAKYLSYNRGFTYLEYLDLFNDHIEEHEYSHYPIFNQARKRKGGINTKKQRYTYLSRYQANEDDYLELYLEEDGKTVLDFFLGQLGKLSAALPLRKIKQHTLVVAPTGSGKSELLRAMFYRMQKRYPKFSIVMIDPHGDLALSIKKNALSYEQRGRLIYIDPYLAEGYTPAFNPFDLKDNSEQNVQHAAEQFIAAFEEILTREGGKPTENMVTILEKALYFILGRGGSTLNTLLELLSPNSPLKEEANEFDPIFDDYFFKPGNKTRDGLYSRLSRLLTNPTLKRVLGGESTFDLERSLNSGKIVLFDLSGFGEMAQVTFGKFLVASIKSYVRKRKKNTGIPIFCFVDEAHALVSGSFEYILSQLRGFGLHTVLATQFIGQFGDQVKDVKKNTAVKIVGGDIEEDVREVLKVEKDLKLRDYEFVLKVRNEQQTVFKSPDFLIKNPKAYGITKEQEDEINRLQLDRYYKVTGQDDHTPRRQQHKQSDDDRKGPPKPPFDLYLGEND
jgi:hypothetical protein